MVIALIVLDKYDDGQLDNCDPGTNSETDIPRVKCKCSDKRIEDEKSRIQDYRGYING